MFHPRARRLAAVAALMLAGLSLGGCVVYDPGPYWHHGYYRPYYY